jgi:hypothetical protein
LSLPTMRSMRLRLAPITLFFTREKLP